MTSSPILDRYLKMVAEPTADTTALGNLEQALLEQDDGDELVSSLRSRIQSLDARGQNAQALPLRKRLVAVLLRYSARSDDDAQAATLAADALDVLASGLDDKESVGRAARVALIRNPGDAEVRKRVAEASGGIPAVLQNLARAIRETPLAEQRATLQYARGLLREDDGHPDAALPDFLAALKANPAHKLYVEEVVRSALVQEKAGDAAEGLLEVARSGSTVPAEARAYALFKLGTLRTQQLKDDKGALQAFLDALVLDKDLKPARKQAEKLAQKLGVPFAVPARLSFVELVTLPPPPAPLHHLVERTDVNDDVEPSAELELLDPLENSDASQEMQSPRGNHKSGERRTVAKPPAAAPTISVIDTQEVPTVSKPPPAPKPPTAEELIKQGKPQEAVALLLQKLTDPPRVPELLMIADLYEDHLKDTAHALEFFGKAARRLAERGDPEDLTLSVAVEGAIRVGGWEFAALGQLADDLKGRVTPAAQMRLERAVANAAISKDPKVAGERLLKLYDQAPEPSLFEEVDRAFVKANDRKGQATLRKSARLKATDAKERLRLAREAAELLKGEGAKAYAAALREVVELDPADGATLERMVLTLEQARGRGEAVTPELCEALYFAAGLQEGEKGIPHLRRLARLLEEAAQPDAATTAWRKVLARRGDDGEALRQLSELLDKAGKPAELAKILETRVVTARAGKDTASEAKLLTRLAALRGAQGDAAARLKLLREVLAADPDDANALPVVEAHLRETNAFAELAALLEDLAKRRAWSGGRLAARLAAANVYREKLGKAPRAQELLAEVLKAEPEHPQALLEMAAVALDQGNAAHAAEHLTRAAKGLKGAARGAALARLGTALESLKRNEDALAAYRQALESDDNNRTAVEALLRLAKETGNAAEARALATQLAALENDPTRRAESLLDLARKAKDNGEVDAALRLYEQALVVDPNRLDASEELCWILVSRGDTRRARSHLERLVTGRGAAKVPPPLLVALARTQAAVGETSMAKERLRAALKQEPAMLEALRALGDLLLADKEEAPRAVLEVLEARLKLHGDALDKAELAAVHAAVGRLKHKLNDSGARAALEKALELLPPEKPDAEVLLHLAQLAEESDKVDDALTHYTRLAKLLKGRESAGHWVKVGMLWARKGDTEQAHAALAEARRLDPTRDDAARAMAEVAASSSASSSVRALLDQLGREKDKRKQSELHLELAKAHRKPPVDHDKLVHHLKLALECDATNAEALKLCEQVLNDKRDARTLAEVYQTVLNGLPGSTPPETRVNLWDKVAVLRRFELRDPPGALKALEEITKLDELNIKAFEDLARLHMEAGNHAAAVAAWWEVLRRNALHVDAYRGLMTTHRRSGDLDSAYLVATTLTALEEGDDEARAVARALRPPFPSWPKPTHDPDQIMRRLAHPLAKGPARALIAGLTPAAWRLFVKPLKDHGLKARDQIDLDLAPSSFALAARHAGRLLGLPPLVLFRGEAGTTPISLVPSEPPGLRLGPDALRGGMTPERAFLFGRTAAYLRPEGLICALLGVTGMHNLLEAAVLRMRPHTDVRGPWQEIDRLSKELGPLIRESDAPRIAQLIQAFLDQRDTATAADVAAGYSYTADRLGFLFAQDLPACLNMIREHPENHVATGTRAAIRELVLFSVSPQLAKLRAGIGIAVDKAAAARALGEK